jgi:hypothetical protein
MPSLAQPSCQQSRRAWFAPCTPSNPFNFQGTKRLETESGLEMRVVAHFTPLVQLLGPEYTIPAAMLAPVVDGYVPLADAHGA